MSRTPLIQAFATRSLQALLLAIVTMAMALTGHAQTLQLSPSDILKRGATESAPSIVAEPATPPPAATPAPASMPAPASTPEATSSSTGYPIPTGVEKEERPPVQGYLYIETYQTRFEVVFDAAVLLQWLMPAYAQAPMVTEELQKRLIEQIKPLAGNWCRLTTQGEKLEGKFLGAHVIKGIPGNTSVPALGEAIPTSEALVGLMWEFPTPPMPETVEVEWSGFIEDINSLGIRVFFGALSEPVRVTRTLPKAVWRNHSRLPPPAPLAAVPAPETAEPLKIPVAAILWFAAGVAFFVWIKLKKHALPGGAMPYLVTWLLGALLVSSLLVVPVSLPGSRQTPVITTTDEAERIVSPLLRNVYRAFDHRSESAIYDILARSVNGELLRQLYLDTLAALTLEAREGARITVSDFTASVSAVEPLPEQGGFSVVCQWTIHGKVGHWGHTHTRVNRYSAKMKVEPVENSWKITQLEVQETARL